MFVAKRQVTIEWGDCDPAGIVFFPRYFAMFDTSTHLMFGAAGIPKPEIIRRWGILGFPMVDTRARFMIPSAYGDTVEIHTAVSRWGTSSFDVEHKLFRDDGKLAIEAFDKRVFTKKDPATGKISSFPIPQEIIARFEKP